MGVPLVGDAASLLASADEMEANCSARQGGDLAGDREFAGILGIPSGPRMPGRSFLRVSGLVWLERRDGEN